MSDTITHLDQVLDAARKFVNDNGSALTHDVGNLADVTTTILQPEPRDGLETALHVLPTFAGNFNNLYQPAHSSLVGLFVFPNFANPIHFLCSAIQAGSRLGYQDSAELCAQYLAPVLDAIKFNYPPAGLNPFNSAATLPKEVAYSEERLRPPPGYKDTTVPGIFARDTPFSHGNHEPGWVVAPGMQGTDVQPFTAGMLTPNRWPSSWVARTPRRRRRGHRRRTAERLRRVESAVTAVVFAAHTAGAGPVMRRVAVAGRRALVVALAAMLTSCTWRGIADVPLPVGRGTGGDHMTIYVQMPDTLALNTNSRVRVADVWVGTVRAITLKDWVATLRLDLDPGVRLPANATAKIGQTSLLGTQHVELAAPKTRPCND